MPRIHWRALTATWFLGVCNQCQWERKGIQAAGVGPVAKRSSFKWKNNTEWDFQGFGHFVLESTEIAEFIVQWGKSWAKASTALSFIPFPAVLSEISLHSPD